jgi:hypothetical protein
MVKKIQLFSELGENPVQASARIEKNARNPFPEIKGSGPTVNASRRKRTKSQMLSYVTTTEATKN